MDDTGRPYTQTIKGDLIERTFSEDVDEEELKWHQDQRDRIVTIIKSDQWYFQKDNELPMLLSDGDNIFIPKESWHRIIKGKGDLVLTIKETK